MATVQLDAITLAQDQRLRRSFFLAGLVVLCYDHLLTLGSEVTHIWAPRLKRSSVWFLLVRYVALISNIVLAAYFLGNLSPDTCTKLSSAENYLLVMQETLVEVTLAIRVCAMYGFSRRVFAALGVAAAITISLGVWAVLGPEVTLAMNLPGCHVATSHTQAVRMAAAWEAQLVCDILILGLTLRRAHTYHRSIGLRSQSLLGTMVRDGAVYFGMICVVNMANIFMLYYGDIVTAGSLAWVASSISVTMISRLILNIHKATSADVVTSAMNTKEAAQSEAGVPLFQRSDEVLFVSQDSSVDSRRNANSYV